MKSPPLVPLSGYHPWPSVCSGFLLCARTASALPSGCGQKCQRRPTPEIYGATWIWYQTPVAYLSMQFPFSIYRKSRPSLLCHPDVAFLLAIPWSSVLVAEGVFSPRFHRGYPYGQAHLSQNRYHAIRSKYKQVLGQALNLESLLPLAIIYRESLWRVSS